MLHLSHISSSMREKTTVLCHEKYTCSADAHMGQAHYSVVRCVCVLSLVLAIPLPLCAAFKTQFFCPKVNEGTCAALDPAERK